MPPTGAAAAPAAASSTASLAPVPPSELNKHDRVRVKWNSAEQSDDGTVTDTTTKLVTATESVGGAFVAYDDGCRNWHFNGDNVTIWRLSAVTALVNLSPTFQSQQEHNRDHDLAVPRVPRALQPA